MTKPLVVCVDDEPAVLASLRRSLRPEPFEVATTTDPAEALSWAETRPVSVVISDQRMPGMTGIELLRKLLDRSPRTACIILTAYPDTAVLAEGAGLPLACLLVKPWIDLHLRRVLRRILATGSPDAEGRIDCRGLQASEVLSRMVRACARGTPVITLRNLEFLDDSVVRVLKGLSRFAGGAPVLLQLGDDSGYARAFRDALGGTVPFELLSTGGA